MQVEEWVDGQGGFARTRQLLAAGATERMLTSAVRTGRLRRARNGWYSTRDPDDPEFRAARVGGIVAGLSALRLLGVWEWNPDDLLRIAVRRGDARLRRSSGGRRRPRTRREPGVVVRWDAELPRRGPTPLTVEPLLDALARTIRDEPAPVAAMALDWAWAEGRVDRLDVESLLAGTGARGRTVALLVDDGAQSILEDAVRIPLQLRGHHVRAQHPLEGGGDIDLVIDHSVGLECDGRRFHADRFEADRSKDLRMLAAGLTPLRVGEKHVRHGWPLLLAALDAALRRHGRLVPAGNSGPDIWRHRDQRLRRRSPRRTPEFPTAPPTPTTGRHHGRGPDGNRSGGTRLRQR